MCRFTYFLVRYHVTRRLGDKIPVCLLNFVCLSIQSCILLSTLTAVTFDVLPAGGLRCNLGLQCNRFLIANSGSELVRSGATILQLIQTFVAYVGVVWCLRLRCVELWRLVIEVSQLHTVQYERLRLMLMKRIYTIIHSDSNSAIKG